MSEAQSDSYQLGGTTNALNLLEQPPLSKPVTKTPNGLVDDLCYVQLLASL